LALGTRHLASSHPHPHISHFTSRRVPAVG
jgi:hypothetical protein